MAIPIESEPDIPEYYTLPPGTPADQLRRAREAAIASASPYSRELPPMSFADVVFEELGSGVFFPPQVVVFEA